MGAPSQYNKRNLFGNAVHASMELTIHKGTPLGDRWGYILGLSKMNFLKFFDSSLIHSFSYLFLKHVPCVCLLDLYVNTSGSHEGQCLSSKFHTYVKSWYALERMKREGVLSGRM